MIFQIIKAELYGSLAAEKLYFKTKERAQQKNWANEMRI